MDLLMYVKKAVALEVLSTFLEELRYESVNLSTEKRLDAILLTTTDVGYRIDQLHQQLKYLLWKTGAVVPLAVQFVLSNTPPRSVIQGLDCCIVNVLLIMVI